MVAVYYKTAIVVVYHFQINIILKERRVYSRVLSNRFAKYYYCKMKGIGAKICHRPLEYITSPFLTYTQTSFSPVQFQWE